MNGTKTSIRPRLRLSGLVLTLTISAGVSLLAQVPGLMKHSLEAKVSLSPSRASAGDVVELKLELKIDDGWYIYDPGFKGTGRPTRVEVSSPVLESAGELKFPPPQKKVDKILNETFLIHKGKVDASWPHRVSKDAAKGEYPVEVKITYQACTELQCLLPKTLTVMTSLVVGEAAVEKNPRDPLGLNTLLAPAGDPVDAAQKAVPENIVWTLKVNPQSVRRGEGATLVVGYSMGEKFHIYSPDQDPNTGAPTRVILEASQASVRPPTKFPEPTVKENFGVVERQLHGEGEIEVPFVVAAGVEPGELDLKVTIDYQICTELLCIPDKFESIVKIRITDEAVAEPGPNSPDERGGPAFLSFLSQAIFWGLITLLMPCTYPMIPITISFFTKQAEKSAGSTTSMALSYGAGIVGIFVVIGVAARSVIVSFAQSAGFNFVLGFLFVAFALVLFGAVTIRLPSSLVALSGKASRRGGFIGVFVLGATLVVTSFTCTAPFVGTLLATGAAQFSNAEVALGMAVFGSTMAIPFVGLALFPSMIRKLPGSGEWMETLKVSFGFVELAAAFKFFSNAEYALGWYVLPRTLFLLIWTAIAMAWGLYLMGLVRLKGHEQSSVGPLRLFLAVVVFMFSAYFVHGAMGNRLDFMMQSIAPPAEAEYYPSEETSDAGAARGGTPWTLVRDDFDGTLARARDEKKLALINWTGRT